MTTGAHVKQQDAGLWIERRGERTFAGRPGLFLDRDGVVVQECHYLHRVEDIVLIDGVAEAIAAANAADIPVILLTNQAGIGRGYYDWAAFEAVQRSIAARLAEREAGFDLVLACAYHADAVGPLKRPDHPWRKPNRGMLDESRRLLGVDLANSFIVGDRLTDLMAGMAAGLSAGALVLTGYGAAEQPRLTASHAGWQAQGFAAHAAADAAVAIREWLAGMVQDRTGGTGDQIGPKTA
jgi:D-glycero-D-manno-heptose 1,7-bisphosphate phosphatase